MLTYSLNTVVVHFQDSTKGLGGNLLLVQAKTGISVLPTGESHTER